jgi:DNA-binding CsgD family transcriptional regulator
MYGARLLAQACTALGDWPRAVLLLGIHEMIGERTGGQAWPHEQADLHEIAVRAEVELGPAMRDIHAAGRVLGRNDQFTAALWPTAGPAAEPGADPGLPLTRRERQIATLIAEGLTNRQIATRLVIAERTVDTHVGRILAKLGCARRAQAAAIVTAAAATRPVPPSG